jgi:two-component system, LytTR family, response regulator
MIRALVVDDEPLAREEIRDLLVSDGEFEVCGECEDGAQAAAMIAGLRPAVVFLDVQMPRLDGFAVVRLVGVESMPLTVFVTAYDQYALKAFEAQALDYVLKPIVEDRFRKVLERVKRRVREGERQSLAEVAGAGRLTFKSAGRQLFLEESEILWFEASGNHVKIRTASGPHVVRETIKNLEARLDSDRFVRIHRSAIVQARQVREIRPWYTGEYVVTMSNGQELTLSRGYRANLPRLRDPGGAGRR